jgi:hypothetical protein
LKLLDVLRCCAPDGPWVFARFVLTALFLGAPQIEAGFYMLARFVELEGQALVGRSRRENGHRNACRRFKSIKRCSTSHDRILWMV